MRYQITITRLDPNPAYDHDRAARGYGTTEFVEKCTQVLSMDVTPEQFDAIRRAALEVSK